jgi:hypothetical protein
MAANDPPKSEPNPSNPSISFNSLKRVIGTGWRESTRTGKHPGEGRFVEPMKNSSDGASCWCVGLRLTHDESPKTFSRDTPSSEALRAPLVDNHRTHNPEYRDGQPRPYREVL